MTSCEITGFNGKTAGAYKLSGEEALDENRLTVHPLRIETQTWLGLSTQVRSVKWFQNEANFSFVTKPNPPWLEKQYLV